MAIVWSRSEDFFNIITDGSYTHAREIFTSFDNKLFAGIADPAVDALYLSNHPFFLDYEEAFLGWEGLKTSNLGFTQGVVECVDELASIKIQEWDTAIQQHYIQSSAHYKILLPKRRKTFQAGTITERVNAINSLITAIGTDPLLATVKASVIAFLILLTAARTKQTNQSNAIDAALLALENARIEQGSNMLFVFASLLKIHYKNPTDIDIFFPVDLLTKKQQVTFLRKLTNMVVKYLFKRKLDITKVVIKTINSSDNIVRIYFTNGITTTLQLGEPFIEMQPRSAGSYNPALMNYADTRRHCYVQNMAAGDANISVSIY